MTSVHTVIESLAAYRAVRTSDPFGKRVWWTTSPSVLTSLAALDEDVRSPEEGLSHDQFNALALAARDLGDEFCYWYQDECAWKNFIQFQFVLALQLTRCAFVTCYKALLLSRVIDSAAGNPVICVGFPGDPKPATFSLAYGRLDTLFSALAVEWGPQGPAVYPVCADPEVVSSVEIQVRHRPVGQMEKFLSLLNSTPSTLVYKVWKNLSRIGLCPSSLSLLPMRRKTYWIYKECESLHEAALGVMMRGGRIAQLPKLPQPRSAQDDFVSMGDADNVVKRIDSIWQDAMERYGVEVLPAYSVAMKLVKRRCLGFLGTLQSDLRNLIVGFDNVTKHVRAGDEILTSALTNPLEGLFYGYCRSRNITVSAFDHGVTLGLSLWSDSEARQAGMLAADRGFYHCPRAVESIRPYAPWQKMHVVGLPRCTARILLPRLQRFLGRRLLRLGQGEQVIMHIPDLERNNFVYGPWQENDLQFLHKTREVTQALCRAYPRSRVVLKLYPTQRYMDSYDFSDLSAEHSNLLVTGDIDFRHLRACSDLIFTASSQSTFGWAGGAGVPLAFMEFQWSGGARINGVRLEWPEIDGLTALIIADQDAACLAPPGNIARAIMGGDELCVA